MAGGQAFWLPVATGGGGGAAESGIAAINARTPAMTGSHFTQVTFISDTQQVLENVTATAAQNDYGLWSFPMTAGIWTLNLLHYKRNVRPIYTFQLSSDASSWVTVGTIDGYSTASSGLGSRAFDAITGIDVGASGLWYLRVILLSRNASATNWYGAIQSVDLGRTG